MVSVLQKILGTSSYMYKNFYCFSKKKPQTKPKKSRPHEYKQSLFTISEYYGP